MSTQSATEIAPSEDEEVSNGASHWARRLTATSPFDSARADGDTP